MLRLIPMLEKFYKEKMEDAQYRAAAPETDEEAEARKELERKKKFNKLTKIINKNEEG